MEIVTLPASVEYLFAKRLAADPDRLRAVPLQVLLQCRATLSHAVASVDLGRTASMMEFRERARLMALHGALVAEIRRRDVTCPPPPAA